VGPNKEAAAKRSKHGAQKDSDPDSSCDRKWSNGGFSKDIQ